ncbi:MAG: hypothetical protein LT082_07810 [Comamonas sp.]|nr:hypothetical protein [Comamonas sp.]
MTPAAHADLQTLVSDAVVGLLRGHAARCQEKAPATVRIPLQVASQADLTVLVRWLRQLCASDALREQFVRGQIDLDIRLAMPIWAEAAKAMPGVIQTETASRACEDAVITEAALRRLGLRHQTLHLRADAVVTPSARDYARTAGIHMQRGDQP